MNEIVKCFRCGHEFELNYGGKMAEDDLVTSQTYCKCKKPDVNKSHTKPLDQALLKLKEILNGKSKSVSKNQQSSTASKVSI
jgi:hypothetical protein